MPMIEWNLLAVQVKKELNFHSDVLHKNSTSNLEQDLSHPSPHKDLKDVISNFFGD